MSDLIYVGFVLAGAMTLVIEAYRNFNAPNARHPFELHPILKEVEVRNLCTTGELVGGFVFYAILYLIAYGVVLSSAEVYSLLAGANNARGEIGAADGVGSLSDASISGILTESAGDYSKPIIVSALIISALTIGAVKPIETTMRALAHRLAGVPRGVYRVIEHIRAVDFEKLMAGQSGPLSEAFKKANSKQTADSKSPIGEALRTIDCLSVVADIDRLARYFPLRNLEHLKPLVDAASRRIADLSQSVSTLQKGFYPAQPGVYLKQHKEFEAKAKALRADLIAIFAVLYIRNDHAVYRQAGKRGFETDPINLLATQIVLAEKREHNAFGISVVAAAIFAFVVAFAIHYKWRYWVGIGGEAYKTEAEGRQEALKTCVTDFTLLCEGAVLEWRQKLIRDIFATVAWDQLQALLVTFFCVLLVILGREVRVEQQSWHMNWKFRRFPFLKLLAMSLMSGLAAVFFTALVKFLQFWWDADFNLSRAQMIGFFNDNIRFMLLQVFGGLALGLSALIIIDKHDDDDQRPVAFTLALAVIGSTVYFLFTLANLVISIGYVMGPAAAYLSMTVRDALIFSLLPAFFLFFFALLLELGERESEKEKSKAQHQRCDELGEGKHNTEPSAKGNREADSGNSAANGEVGNQPIQTGPATG